MGSSDTPPPHVPPSYMLITNTLLQIGGLLWTACYILSTRVSFKTKTYGMPIFALAFNFGWELIYLMVAPSFLEKAVFTLWCVLDVFLFIGVFKYGEREWKHSPFVGRNLGKIVLVMTIWCCGFHYVSSRFWIENLIGRKEGKGDGADMTELAFWSAAVAQAYGSMACLAQLVVRQHTGGVSWGIWATRTLGSFIAFDVCYFWMWLFWREAHEYFMSPLGVFLWSTGLVCDLVYPFVFYSFRKTERVLPDGSKAPGLKAEKKIR